MIEIVREYLESEDISIYSTAPQLGRACVMHGNEEGFMATGHAGAARGRQARILAKYVGGCGAGIAYCSVQPNGAVTPCVFMPITLGNIRQQKLIEIWQNHPLLSVLRDRDKREGNCKSCKYKYYCGGCRARAYGYTRDVRASDPGCLGNLKLWNTLINTAGDNPEREKERRESTERFAGRV